MGSGCSGIFKKEIQILMGKCAPQNYNFFHLFCDLYYYPCVQWRIELVYDVLREGLYVCVCMEVSLYLYFYEE